MLTAQIRVNIKCLSINARDLQIVTGDYPAPHEVPQDCVPISGELEDTLVCDEYEHQLI